MNYEESDVEKIRLGTLYHFGAMYLLGGIDANGISGGAESNFSSATLLS